MSRCRQCAFDWWMPSEQVVPVAEARLRRLRDRMATELATEQGRAAVCRRRDEQVWSPLEYLAHLRDVTDFFAERIDRLLNEDHPVLHVGIRFAELAELRSYRTEDPTAVLAQLATRAEDLQQVLLGLDDAQWARAGTGSGGEERTVTMLGRRFAHELHHHLIDIEGQLIATAPPDADEPA